MKEIDLTVDICGVKLKNPVTTASGTFGMGSEFAQFIDLERLGAVTVKTITLEPREGNPPPRIFETASGMLNSIGLQNKGVDEFLKVHLPYFGSLSVPLIVNIAGRTVAEYEELARRLDGAKRIDLLELNISCPNVKEGGIEFGVNARLTEELVRAVAGATSKPLIVKLSPNVTNIVEIAQAAVAGGAGALSLINTLRGLAIDIHTFRSQLGGGFGGLSGPAIRPVALRMVYEVAQAVQVPIIGIGGIETAEHAVEFLLAGASAVAVGTANFHDPCATTDIIDGLEHYLKTKNFSSVTELVGLAKVHG